MKLQLERKHVEALAGQFPRLATLQDQLRFGNKAEAAFSHFTSDEVSFLRNLYEEAGPDFRARAAQLATLQKALNDDGIKFEQEDLEQLVPAIARYLAADAVRGWLFQANVAGKPMAWVVTRLDFTPPGNEETGKVMVELKANAKGKLFTASIRIYASDIAGRSVGEIFAAKGFLKETPALIATYDEAATRYFDWRARYGAQFSGRGTGFYAENPTASHRDTDWARKDVVVLSSAGGYARLVNDEEIIGDRALAMDAPGDILGPYLRRAGKSMRYRAEDDVEAAQGEMPKGLFTELPVHFYILMFHLDLHHYLWVHVDDIKPYEYQPALKQKLILPEEQTDLIDILTAEMDMLMDDIVEGKSGGTTVLCAGPAGRRGQNLDGGGVFGNHQAAFVPDSFRAVGLECGGDGNRAERCADPRPALGRGDADRRGRCVYQAPRRQYHHECRGRRVPARVGVFQRFAVFDHQPRGRHRRGHRLALHRDD